MGVDLKNKVVSACLDSINDQDIATWFKAKLSSVDQPSVFFLAFGMINKKVERVAIQPNAELLTAFTTINPGFDESSWTLDEFCRMALLMRLPPEENAQRIKTLLSTSDIREQVTIYKSIQYLTNPEAFLLTVIDGIRTNMVDVFDAITANNSYPLRFFEESSWNQMVLKSIFMERPIFKIQGIDKRRNEKLAFILHDFVHERWSAHRPVTPELWRMMVGFVNHDIFEDLKKVATNDNELSKIAALRVIQESNFDEATSWIANIENQPSEVSWDELGSRIFLNHN